MPASSRIDLNAEYDKNDETCKNENFKDGEIPAMGPNNYRRERAHQILLINGIS